MLDCWRVCLNARLFPAHRTTDNFPGFKYSKRVGWESVTLRVSGFCLACVNAAGECGEGEGESIRGGGGGGAFVLHSLTEQDTSQVARGEGGGGGRRMANKMANKKSPGPSPLTLCLPTTRSCGVAAGLQQHGLPWHHHPLLKKPAGRPSSASSRRRGAPPVRSPGGGP